MKLRNNRGLTIVELMIVLALLSMVIAPAYMLLGLGNRVHSSSIEEYELQSTARLAAAHINRAARFSSAIFTIPRSSFQEDNLSAGWSYIGVLDGAVVAIEYSATGHHKTELVPASDNVTYEIVFKKVLEDHQEKIVGFSINGYIDGRPVKTDEYGQPLGHISIDSQAEALNSLQVIHKGTALDPAVAIAFRRENRDKPEIEATLPVAQIAMVLDVSGSMEYQMNGTTTNTEANRRITKLKSSSKKLVEQFAASEHPVYVSLVPFATSANNPKPFRPVQTDISALYNDINSLTAGGGTNTGDGIRRAYHGIINGRNNADFVGKEVSDYIIILVDGVTTFGSVQSNSNRSWVTHHNNVNEGFLDRGWLEFSANGQIAGNGSELDLTWGEGYVQNIGSMVKSDGNIKVYVIGFSSRSADFGSLANIAASTGALPTSSGQSFFEAGDEEELDLVFGEIQKEIINNLWHIDGPNL
ncbi:MAG TPA: VWA domain-containing protein [Oscillospiraceae bacterium]|nr:VWA domain-containing protein [Oscillospiraceae bacterium]